MTIQEYYKLIKQKIESGDFTFKTRSKELTPSKEECKTNSHLESIHYLMFEFMDDRKDKRKSKVFDYVCVPKGVNQGELDIDFTNWKIEDFLREIMKLKD